MEIIQKVELTQEQLESLKQEWSNWSKPVKEFMTVEETAEYLEISKSAVYKLTSKRKIPFYNPGGKKIYFKKIEVDDWIENSRVASDAEAFHHVEARLNNLERSGL